MNVLIVRATARHLLRHPWQLALAILGIALGVAVVCAVQLTQASARQALTYAQRSLTGPSTHRIEAFDGEHGLDEQAFAALALRWPRVDLLPVVTGSVMLPGPDGASLQIAGIDVLTTTQNGSGARRLGHSFDVTAFVGRPGTAVVNEATARRLGLVIGARLTVEAGAHTRMIEIVGIAPDARDGGAADDVLVMDIASAQEVLDAAGRLSAIEVSLPSTGRTALATALRADLPAGWRLVSNATRLGAAREMTRAFDVNLTALSLLALLVGMFLIYNTASFLALQRKPIFSRLRALGVLERELFGALLSEACVLGVIGVGLGLVLGRLVAGVLLQFVARTVNDLYYRAAITEVATPAWLLAAIAALGFAATLIAALPPIRAVTRESIGAAVRNPGSTREPAARLPLALAGACWLVGIALLVLPTRALWPGFGALFAFLVGAALPLPWLLARLSNRGSHLPALAPPTLLALRALAAHGHRTGLAAAALMVACATGIAITIMIGSFRASVTDWLSTLLRADVYVSLERPTGASDERPLAALRDRLAARPEVATTSAVVRTTTHVTGSPVPVRLLAYDLPPAARTGYQFIAGDVTAIWQQWEQADVAIVTEPFAYRHHVDVGDRLRLDTAAGDVEFAVLGIYRDYASERGSVALSRATWQRHFPRQDDSGLGIYRAAGVTLGGFERAVRQALRDLPDARMQSNARLRELSLAVFDQTFAVTDLLRLLALGVALVGIVSALLAQQMERIGDYALMRALGFRRGEMLRVVLIQTLAAGALAASVARPVGVGRALLLIDVINVRSFGWTMSLHWAWPPLFGMWVSALLASLLAGLYPALVATRRTPATVLRND